MERTMDSQLDELKRLILVMGGYVERALSESTQALISRNVESFAQVHEIEKKINEEHVAVDNACLAVLAKQGPVAKDLRLILSIVKINTDLERMGDQCVNIAYTGKDYLARKPLPNVTDITRMSELTRAMVKESLDCFVRGDVALAKKILLMDDEVDGLKNKVYKDNLNHMKTSSSDVEACLDLILVARNLERLGDHATNIAEDVIFACTGKDVRHGGKYT